MAGDVAQWIQRWLEENVIVIGGGSRKRSRGSIGALMQSDVKMANQIENLDRIAETPLLLCFFDQFVPDCTEVMLKPRKGMANVKIGKFLHTQQAPVHVFGMNDSARDVDQGSN